MKNTYLIFVIATLTTCVAASGQETPHEKLRKAWLNFFEKQRQPSALESDEDKPATAAESLELAQGSLAQWVSPTEITSQNGLLQATLVVDYSVHQIGPDPVRLRTYNGQLVGPTLRAKPGDKLKIKIVNELSAETPHSGDHNSHHGWNTTNLHTHGLHVSPSGTSDNVFLRVEPKTSQSYEIDIPLDHPAGTFWYHAHKHGAVSSQVASGMAGALIIDGLPDAESGPVLGAESIKEIGDAKERILVFQQIPYVMDSGFGVVEIPNLPQMFRPGAWDALGRHTTVNGVRLPVITMRPGEVQRWRMVHSGFRESLQLRLIRNPSSSTGPSTIPMHEFAVDGLALKRIRTPRQIEMWPGYRSDVLVKAPDSQGEFLLVDERTGPVNSLNGLSENRKFVARVVVEGTELSMRLPDPAAIEPIRLPSIAPSEVTGTQTVTYGINVPPLRFEIDGREYDPNHVRKLSLGKTEEWIAQSENNVGAVHHPFHIHVNPFEVFSVVDDNGNEQLSVPEWRDTVILRAGWTVRFRTHYKRFTGKFVQHCHILDHEDQGMMEAVEIVDPSSSSALEADQASAAAWSPRLLMGKVAVLNFFTGTECEHCNQQLAALAKRASDFETAGIPLVCISASELSGESSYPFKLLSDSHHELFERFGCFDDGPQHGTIVLDEGGSVTWRVSGDAPFTDVDTILEAATTAQMAATGAPSALESDESELRLRKSVDELSPDELSALKHAFKILRDRSPDLVSSLAHQVSLHNGDAGPCEHGSELFLPWHRAHLYFFEKHLRESDPPRTKDVTLPYWDWTKKASGGRYPRAFEDDTSVLFHAIRRRSGGTLPTPTEIDDIVENDDWLEFGGRSPGFGELELKPHNYMHGTYISGSMGNPTSAAEDPIYWAFHCYLDLLWDRWQKKHNTDPTCMECQLRGMPNQMKVEDVLSVESQLGYTYMQPEINLEIATSGALESDSDEFTLLQSALTIPRQVEGAPRLNFSSIKVPSDQSYRVDLYLHPKNVRFENTQQFKQQYQFDYFVMWKSQHSGDMQSHHPKRAPVSLRGIEKVLPALCERHAGEAWQITMVGSAAEESALEVEAELDIDFGKVSIGFK